MVIYDVYEELEKPDEREILFINRILDGKFGFSSFEEMEDIYLTSCNNENDNCDFINNGVTCKNVISLNIFDKLSFEEEDYTHHHNQSFLSKEKDINGATKILIVSSLLERCYEPSKWQDNVKNNQQTFHFSRERSIFHNNVKMFYLSTTTLIIFGYVLLTSKLLMLLIYLQMLKKQSRLEDELL